MVGISELRKAMSDVGFETFAVRDSGEFITIEVDDRPESFARLEEVFDELKIPCSIHTDRADIQKKYNLIAIDFPEGEYKCN